MTKKAKPKPRKTAKRGPKEERLIVTGDPGIALDRILNKPKA